MRLHWKKILIRVLIKLDGLIQYAQDLLGSIRFKVVESMWYLIEKENKKTKQALS